MCDNIRCYGIQLRNDAVPAQDAGTKPNKSNYSHNTTFQVYAPKLAQPEAQTVLVSMYMSRDQEPQTDSEMLVSTNHVFLTTCDDSHQNYICVYFSDTGKRGGPLEAVLTLSLR